MSSCLLLSGGLDSVALCYLERPALALTIDYGQLAAEAEINAAEAVCQSTSIRHHVLRADCACRSRCHERKSNRAHTFVTITRMVAIPKSVVSYICGLGVHSVATNGNYYWNGSI